MTGNRLSTAYDCAVFGGLGLFWITSFQFLEDPTRLFDAIWQKPENSTRVALIKPEETQEKPENILIPAPAGVQVCPHCGKLSIPAPLHA